MRSSQTPFEKAGSRRPPCPAPMPRRAGPSLGSRCYSVSLPPIEPNGDLPRYVRGAGAAPGGGPHAAGVTLEGAARLESAPRVRAVDPRARAWARSVAWRGCPSAPRPDRAARADDSGARTGSRAVPGPCPATGRAAPRPVDFLRQQGQNVRLATYDARMIEVARRLGIPAYAI